MTKQRQTVWTEKEQTPVIDSTLRLERLFTPFGVVTVRQRHSKDSQKSLYKKLGINLCHGITEQIFKNKHTRRWNLFGMLSVTDVLFNNINSKKQYEPYCFMYVRKPEIMGAYAYAYLTKVMSYEHIYHALKLTPVFEKAKRLMDKQRPFYAAIIHLQLPYKDTTSIPVVGAVMRKPPQTYMDLPVLTINRKPNINREKLLNTLHSDFIPHYPQSKQNLKCTSLPSLW